MKVLFSVILLFIIVSGVLSQENLDYQKPPKEILEIPGAIATTLLYNKLA